MRDRDNLSSKSHAELSKLLTLDILLSCDEDSLTSIKVWITSIRTEIESLTLAAVAWKTHFVSLG